MDKKFRNGQKVRDRLSGFEGTITCCAEYMNGCIRYNVQPELDEEGHYQDSEVIDEQQLVLLMDEKQKKLPKKNGGDRSRLPEYVL